MSKQSPTKKKATTKKKKKSSLLDNVTVDPPSSSNSNAGEASSSPKLDRFGLPIPTEEDIFPPLSADISRTPVVTDTATGTAFDRDEVADAIQNHLQINLDAFSNDDEEDNNNESKSNKWKLNMLHKDPPVFTIDNFFTKEECDAYQSMASEPSNFDNNEQQQTPKAVQITSPTFSSHSISRRTSTTWFCRYKDVPTLLAKARHLLNGDKNAVELNQMEEPQIVRYRTGEEFSWHYDEIPANQLENGGQRLATLLVYLNDLEEGRGGGTVFRDLTPPPPSSSGGSRISEKKPRRSKGKNKSKSTESTANQQQKQLTVRPKTGTALLFFPSYKDGKPDIRTLHKGEVAKDTKMIAQLWIHQREYRAGVPEGNCQSDAEGVVEMEDERLGFL